METVMGNTTRRRRGAQLTLFCERAVLPNWHELDESTRVEIVRLLAKLLLERRIRLVARRSGGRCDE
jgi:hypothetical protein